MQHTTLQKNRLIASLRRISLFIGICLFVSSVLVSCARMGQPDGGWYDETPPKVLGSHPNDKAVNVNNKKIQIFFDEFIKIENATENVIVSPPQLEMPEIKSAGRNIIVELKDSLKPNITYTIDFSDAITDNNEGNPLGNYTYSFSTGTAIDTLEVSGHVLDAENLEPIKGILVGLHSNLEDSAFKTQPLLRVSRTDSRGRFVVKGIAPGNYRIYALQDADGDYRLSQKSEKLAFSKDIIVPSFRPDIKQDTIWKDSLRINSIERKEYTRFLPDDIVLKAFGETVTDRFFLKAERPQADRFSLFFSYGNEELPQINGLNFNAQQVFVTEATEKQDTITYWLKDTTLVNQDTLRMVATYLMTDSTGRLVHKNDTLELVSKQPYAKRIKEQQKKYDEWKKAQEKAQKRGEPFETEMRPQALKTEIKIASQMAPDRNIVFDMPTPIAKIDTSKIHLYSMHDSLWYQSRYQLYPTLSRDSINTSPEALLYKRSYQFVAEWKPGIEYSLEIDSAAFIDIYGHASEKMKQGFKVKSLDEYGTLLVNVSGMGDATLVVQLLNNNDQVLKEVSTNNSTAEFFYITEGKYFMRLFVDSNKNGKWDTGEYDSGRQAEEVYYYPEEIQCKAKWDVTQTWNPKARPSHQQKPSIITKQKPDKARTIKKRNLERARQLGKEYMGR